MACANSARPVASALQQAARLVSHARLGILATPQEQPSAIRVPKGRLLP